MRSLWVFGDSFSEDIYLLPTDTDRILYSKKFLKKRSYKIWSELVASKLGYQYKNYAALNSLNKKFIKSGNTNDDCLNALSYFSNKFEKDDVVFIGITDTSRYKLPPLKKGYKDNPIHPQIITNDSFIDKFIDTTTLYKLCILRGERVDYYMEEFMIRLNPIIKLSELIGFQVFIWSWVDEINKIIFENDFLHKKNWVFLNDEKFKNYNFSYYNFLKSFGIPTSIFEATNGEIIDYHQSEESHILHSEFLINILNQK